MIKNTWSQSHTKQLPQCNLPFSDSCFCCCCYCAESATTTTRMASPPNSGSSPVAFQPRPISLDLVNPTSKWPRPRSESWQENNFGVEPDDGQEISTFEPEIMCPVLPTNWNLDNGEDLVASVYSFLKAYLRSVKMITFGISRKFFLRSII